MPTLLEQIPDISGITDLATGESGKMSGIVTALADFPFSEVQSIASDLGSTGLPDLVPLLDQFPSNLGDLSTQVTSGISGLLGDLDGALGGLQDLFGEQFLDQISPALEQLGSLNELVELEEVLTTSLTTVNPLIAQLTNFDAFRSQDPAQLLDMLSGAMAALPPLEGVTYYDGLNNILNTLKAWGDFTPENLGAFVADTLGGLHEALNTLNDNLQAELERLQSAADLPSLADIETELQNVQAPLATLQGLDFSVGDQLSTAIAAATALQTALDSYASLLTGACSQVADSLQAVSPDALLDKLYALYFALQELAGFDEAENPVERFLDSMEGFLDQIDSDFIQVPLQETLTHLTGFIDQLDLSAIQDPILQVAEQITQAADQLEQLQTQVVLAIKDIFDEIRGAIESIDLQVIQDAFQGVLTTFSTQLEPVRTALTTLRDTVDGLLVDLGTSLDEIDLPALASQLTTALSDVIGLLGSPEVTGALGTIQESLDAMAEQLQAISFAPVIDEVLGQIDEMRQQLSEIDVSSLNDLLRVALAAALEVVQSLDFQGEVVDLLVEQFNGIADVPQQLLADAVSSFNLLEAKIQELQPSALIADALDEPLQLMKDGLASIQPSQVLQPVQEQFDAFMTTLDALAPSELVAPLDEFLAGVVSLIDSVASLDILAPLEATLGQLRALVDSIDLDAWLADMQGYIDKASTLFGDFALNPVLSSFADLDLGLSNLIADLDPDGIADSILALFDPILALFDQVDLGPISAAATSLTDLLDGIQVDAVNQALTDGFGALTSVVGQLDVTSAVTTLAADWRGVRDALAAVTPPPEFQDEYDALTALINATNPTTILTPVAASVTDLETSLGTLHQQSSSAVQSVAEPFGQAVNELRALFPENLTAATLKDAIREAISDALLTPLKKLIGVVRDKVQVFSGLLDTVEDAFNKLRSAAQVILNPLSLLEPIQAGLNSFKEKLSAFSLDFLQEEIQASAQVVEDLVAGLNLADLLAPMDAAYQAFIDELSGLLSSILAHLDQIYTDHIAGLLDDLNLEDLLAPLDTLFADLLVALEPFGIESLLAPVQNQMGVLEGELTSGLQRAGNAFEQMLAAIPV